MKIALLTLPLHYNYGGNLQCYALVTILKRMGHEVENIKIIQDIKLPSISQRPYLYSKRLINKILGRANSYIFTEQKMIRDKDIVHKYSEEFITKYIPQTIHQYRDATSLESLNQYKFDAFIVGSDQVWRPKYAFPDLYSNFFSFLKDNKLPLRISYAASFGTSINEYSEQEIKKCGSLIRKFDAVSVREDSAIQLIQNQFHWECPQPQHVLDPTMLLRKEDYLELNLPVIESKQKKELFYYILDMTPDKKRSITEICNICNIKSFTISPQSTYVGSKAEKKTIPPVEEWIQGFNRAKIIITDSFHGCVFSIIFNKPFIVYANSKRGIARFHSLLKTFNLESRLIINSHELTHTIINSTIDWNHINYIWEKKRQESISFLQNSLNKKTKKTFSSSPK